MNGFYPTDYTCYTKRCHFTVHKVIHQVIAHHIDSLGLHYVNALRWPIAIAYISIMALGVALVALKNED